MRIGIVDVDGHHFPNLALMKLSAWHKSEGDSVEFADAMFGSYDRVYMSKVFTFTPDCSDYYPCEVVKAGTGYRDYTTTLPESIEHMCPDYSLYGVDEAYGFLTRGCPNHCPWCIVPHKEGSIRPASPIREFIGNKRRAVLLDNNVLASDFGLEQIEEIANLEKELQSSFFGPNKIPTRAITSGNKYSSIRDVVRYVQWQNATGSLFDDDTATSCMSYYGLCE